MVSELTCFFLAGLYLAFAPRIYEANFSVRLPKVQVVNPLDASKMQWKLMLSGLDYMRSMQDPMNYPNAFIKDCLGEDSNTNRRKFINSLQIGLLNHADVIQFSLKIAGRENAVRCIKMLQARVLDDLDGVFNSQLSKINENQNPTFSSEKPALLAAIRESDSFVQPQVNKILIAAAIVGIFMAVFIARLKAKYRA